MIRTPPVVRRCAALPLLALTGVVLGLAAPPAAASTDAPRTYWLSSTGSDAADGLSTGTAWRSLNRISAAVLHPGDRVLLQGGATFPGSLYLDAADAGDPAHPVVLASYGTGRARISSAGTSGVFVYDTSGVDVRNLVVTGDATSYRRETGVGFYSDRATGRLPHVRISGVDVSGFRHGIAVGAGSGALGFSDVVISGSKVHDNLVTGLITYGPSLAATAPVYANTGVTVSKVQAYSNVGDATDRTANTGSGIVLGSVQGGSVVGSSAWANGSACAAPEGPVGIWTYDADSVVIRGNVSHDNRTGGTADGDGFDLDQNVSRSVLERNLSYGNDGAGLLVYTGQANGLHRDNVVRFNISQGDGRKGGYGALTLWGRVTGTQVYDNTIVTQPAGTVRPPVVKLMPGLSGVSLRNNVLVSDGAGPLLTAPSGAGVLLQGNDWWATSGAPWQVMWGSSTLTSLSALRTTARQELSGRTPTGLDVDPALVDAHTPLSTTDPAKTAGAAGMAMRAASPLLGAGLDLRTWGTAPGALDYFGGAVSASGPYDIGAHHLLR